MSATIWAARCVILVAFLDLFIQFPVVAPYARGLGASAGLVGVIVGAYSATNLVGNLLGGWITDRLGRKRPVMIGLLVTAATLGSYALASRPEHLLAIRALHGLAAAVLTPGAFALIGDAALPARRARAMGASGVVIALAAIVGPPLSGAIRDRLGAEAVFLGGGLLLLGAAAVFGYWARETGDETGGQRFGAYLSLWSRRPLVAAYLGALAMTVGLGTLITQLPLALEARGESAGRAGLAFSVFALVAIVAMAGPAGRLGDRSGRTGPVTAGLAVIGVGLGILALSGSLVGVGLGMGVFGLGFGLLFPSAAALVADAAARHERGSAFGIFYAVYSLGVVIGSVLSGALGEWLGVLSGGPFLVAGLVALAAAPAIPPLGRRPSVVETAARAQ